jgi:vacuolar-type H+-ATPase subunit H
MAQQASEIAEATSSSARSTAKSAARSGQKVAARTTGEGRRVASRTSSEGRKVAARGIGEAQDVASTATQHGQELVRSASEQGRELVGTVKERASEVTGELFEQGQTLAEDARTQIEQQAKEQTRRLAGTLNRLGNEAQALADGRPEDAETVREYVRRAGEGVTGTADRLYGLADDVEQRGLGGLFEDLSTFARRRPGAFLLGAAIAGFGVARVVRSSKSDSDGEDESAQPAAVSGRVR